MAIGPRLGEMTTSGYTLLEPPRPRQKLVHIHSSAEELNRVYQADLAICATMNAAARSLEVLAAPPTLAWSEWNTAAHGDYEANLTPQDLPGDIDMAAMVATLQRLLPADAVLTNGAGNFASWLHRFYRYPGLARGHKTQLACTNGAMGYGVPAGIAANLLTGRTAFTITGDGDFLMNGQELATATGYLPPDRRGQLVSIVVDNGTYGTIRMHQEREYPGRVSGSDLFNPDFAALARAYGWRAARADATADFEAAFAQALQPGAPMLIHLKLDADVSTSRSTLTAIREAARRAGR